MIGGGYVGVEFASMFARLGVEVSLFYRDHLPLRGFDDLLRRAAATALTDAGVHLVPGVVPRQVEREGDGLLLRCTDAVDRSFPWVLNATGRRPVAAGLGVEVAASGAVVVDEALRTSLPGVYAVGDLTNRHNLTPVAIAEGRALADALFGADHPTVDLRRVPSAVFMSPPIGTVGPTEDEAVAAGHDVEVYETTFRPMKVAFVGGAERTSLKLLVDASDGKVLAVHLLGADAPEIVQCLAVALTAGATKRDFDRTLAVHPTAAEEFVLLRQPTRIRKAAR
jgi:glutathione reductase (NADPH)